VGDVGQAVGGAFVVVPAIGGIDAMAGIEVPEGLQGRVIVPEEFHEDMLEGAGPGHRGEEGPDPAIVGGETSAGGHGGSVEAAEFARCAHLRDEILVLRNSEIGVSAVGGIGEGLEELVSM